MEYAFISDIHGNLPALECVLDEVAGYTIYCAGDLVGYGPWPNEVVDCIRSMDMVCVRGNHDYAAVTDDTSGFNYMASEAAHWSHRRMTADNIRYLSSLPEVYSSGDLLIVHGSPRDQLNEYVYPEDPYFEALFDGLGEGVIVLGHTHVPFVRRVGGKIVFNPGSVGQPRDGNPGASYATYDTEEEKVVFHRVEYPIDDVVEMVEAQGLPLKIGQRLYLGV